MSIWYETQHNQIGKITSMLVTDVGDQMCWWQVWDNGYIEKITNITKKVANIMILSPTSEISHHHKVTNITMSPTSLSPFWRQKWLSPTSLGNLSSNPFKSEAVHILLHLTNCNWKKLPNALPKNTFRLGSPNLSIWSSSPVELGLPRTRTNADPSYQESALILLSSSQLIWKWLTLELLFSTNIVL